MKSTMLIKSMVLMGVVSAAAAFTISTVRFDGAPDRALREIHREMAKRSFSSQLNQYAGFDTLGGMGLGKRSEPEQAGEKRAAMSTFDSLGGMGLGKRSSAPSFYLYDKRVPHQMTSLDTLGGMGFGRK